MKSLTEIADFIENHIVECNPNTGCARCDEARECVKDLRGMVNELNLLLDDKKNVLQFLSDISQSN